MISSKVNSNILDIEISVFLFLGGKKKTQFNEEEERDLGTNGPATFPATFLCLFSPSLEGEAGLNSSENPELGLRVSRKVGGGLNTGC